MGRTAIHPGEHLAEQLAELKKAAAGVGAANRRDSEWHYRDHEWSARHHGGDRYSPWLLV
jgi:hypothetical protein